MGCFDLSWLGKKNMSELLINHLKDLPDFGFEFVYFFCMYTISILQPKESTSKKAILQLFKEIRHTT
jgi:hypothetical protein